MALLWFDGFESYGSIGDLDIMPNLEYYDIYFGFSTLYGRRDSRGMTMSQYCRYVAEVTGSPSSIVVGVAFKIVGGAPGAYSSFYSVISILDAFPAISPAANKHLSVSVNASRVLEVRHGDGTLIATSSGHTMLNDVWYYLEVKATISDSVGQVTINVDEQEVLSTSANKDTCNGSNAYVGSVWLANTSGINSTYFDDFYICDTSGSKNNDFLGDIRIDAVRPDGAGTHTDFTPSTGSNYQNVDETYPDDDTTYNDGDTVGYQDSYGLPALPSPVGTTIYGVKDQITVRKTDAGAMQCKLLTVQGGSDYLGDTIQLSDSFTTHARIMENNPDDSAAWEDADISSGELGVEITA